MDLDLLSHPVCRTGDPWAKPSRPSTRHTEFWWLPAVAAVAAILVRLPYLQHSAGFFDIDEAIEGLMARHLSDVPAFVWGQGYKGVPEIYLSAPVFALFGVGVIQLKAVTLAIWAVAVALTTRLGQRWYGNAGGAVVGGVLATGSPALIFWSLSGRAEVAWLTVIFSAVLLAYQWSIDAPDRPTSALVFIGCGAALWVHPDAIVFVATLAIVAACRSRWWRQHGWAGVPSLVLGRNLSGIPRVIAVVLHVGLVTALATFLLTFAGARLNVGIMTAAHPQKVLRVLMEVASLTIAVHALLGTFVQRRRGVISMGWFALGCVPVVLHLARGGGLPVTLQEVRHLSDVPRLIRILVHDAVPVFAGAKNMVSDWLVPWWYAAGFGCALCIHAVGTAREWARISAGGRCAPSAVFAVLAAAGLFTWLVPGGVFRDQQSYRDLMPFFGLAALSVGSGVRFVWMRSRMAGLILAGTCLAGFHIADLRWLLDLGPDPSDRIITCLEANDIHAAVADDLIAYRLTFLSDERVVVNASSNPRYPPYTDIVRGARPRVLVRLIDRGVTGAATGQVLCRSGSYEAVVLERIQ